MKQFSFTLLFAYFKGKVMIAHLKVGGIVSIKINVTTTLTMFDDSFKMP